MYHFNYSLYGINIPSLTAGLCILPTHSQYGINIPTLISGLWTTHCRAWLGQINYNITEIRRYCWWDVNVWTSTVFFFSLLWPGMALTRSLSPKKATIFQRTPFEKNVGPRTMLDQYNSSLVSGRTQNFWHGNPIFLEQLRPRTQ